ncbi:MAG: hypothetical protein ACYS8K_11365 [Planctomycetota bacterium]
MVVKRVAMALMVCCLVGLWGCQLVGRSGRGPCACCARGAVASFRRHLKEGRAEKACGMFLEPVDEAAVRRTARYCEEMRRGEHDFAIVAAQQDRDCAVVLLREEPEGAAGAGDLDPLFLVRREGIWRLMLDSYQFYALEPEQTARLRKLRHWYTAEGRRLGPTQGP